MNSFSTQSTTFQQGSIFYGKMPLPDGSHRNKFLIVLNKQSNDQVIHFTFTTSRMTFYNKYPLYRSHFIKIPKGTLDFFPVKTLINLSTIHSKPRFWLIKAIKHGQLRFLGVFPSEYLDKIKEVVESSILIEENVKKRIV